MEKFDLVVKVGQLVTPLGSKPMRSEDIKSRFSVLKDAYIGIKGGIISKVTMDKIHGKEFLDCSNCVCLPGLIDCHTHIPFYGYRWEEFLMRASGVSYMEILRKGGGIIETMKKVREATEEELTNFNLKLLDSMLKNGYTTVEGKSGYGLSKESELKQLKVLKKLNETHSIDIVATFLGAHAIPPEFNSSSEYLDYIMNELLPYVKDYTEFVDIFCEKGVFEPKDARPFLKKAMNMGYKVRMHADEIENVGATRMGVEIGAVSVDHIVNVNEDDIELLSKSDTIAVLLPATSFFLSKPFAPARSILNKGGIVAVASDFNPGSSMLFDPSVLAFLSVMKLEMKVEEFITAMTVNAANVLGISDYVGTIEEGKKADMVLMDIPDYRSIPYFVAQMKIKYVLKSGKVVHKE